MQLQFRLSVALQILTLQMEYCLLHLFPLPIQNFTFGLQ